MKKVPSFSYTEFIFLSGNEKSQIIFNYAWIIMERKWITKVLKLSRQQAALLNDIRY
jgi:hypothetical protein